MTARTPLPVSSSPTAYEIKRLRMIQKVLTNWVKSTGRKKYSRAQRIEDEKTLERITQKIKSYDCKTGENIDQGKHQTSQQGTANVI